MIEASHGKITDTCFETSQPYRQSKEGFVDIHCHCLPGLDDGPATQEEAIELCRQMAEDGITAAIATPHQLGRFELRNKAKYVRKDASCFNKILRENNVAINILPGAEVRVDERVCRLKETDEILTLADGGRYILLELPNDIFIDIDFLIQELASIGVQSVIAHAERIPHFSLVTDVLSKWLTHGGLFQVTASSIIGVFGIEFQANAWQLLNSRQVSFIATDCHDTKSRKPQMRAAFQFVKDNLGQETAHRLCIENPSKILSGQNITSVSVFHRQGQNIDK